MAVQDKECNLVFHKLESELRNAIELDDRRAQQDAAKFRAVNQNAACTYDEFRQIVNAAHLKPLNKSDKVRSTPKAIWNSFSSSKRKKNLDNQSVKPLNPSRCMESQLHDDPQSTHEFANLWHKLDMANDERYKLLKSLPWSRLTKLLTSEACFGLLGDVLRALACSHEDTTDDFAFVVHILELLAQMRRFALNLQFLDADERRECRGLFQRLRTEMRDKLQDLAEMHAITEWTLQELERKYESNLT